MRGPSKNYIVRKKENLAGLWINRSRVKFFDVPAFYAIASSKPLSEITQTYVSRPLGIDSLLPNYSGHKKIPANVQLYADAFLDYQYDAKRYTRDVGTVSFMEKTLFKTTIDFPDTIPPGDYTAEIYLLNNGRITSTQKLPIHVVKTGLDAWIYNSAHQYPVLYGIGAIAMAVGIGWLAGRAFTKA